MKTAAKAFLVISMVLSIIGALVIIGGSCATASNYHALLAGCSCASMGGTFIFALIALIPGIVCYIAYVAIDNATYKREIITISLVTLFLGSPIAGILMLLIPEREL